MSTKIVLGVDIGTQGVRSLAVAENGIVQGRGSAAWEINRNSAGYHEQDPLLWFSSTVNAIRESLSTCEAENVVALSVCGTSGTLVIVDAHARPVRPAIMWDDTRAGAFVDELSEAVAPLAQKLGLRMRPSFPLAKLLWLRAHEPHIFEEAAWIMHQSDWLLWMLGGLSGRPVTEPTNALKTGYDPVFGEYLIEITRRGFADFLPTVVSAGTVIGFVPKHISELTSLPVGVALITAMTDANTASVAAGISQPGDWGSTLGTGLSLKSLSKTVVANADFGLYSHPHPFGGFLVSGTVHTGAGVVSERFGTGQKHLDELTEAALSVTPGRILTYPLNGRGEFFPFWAPDALGFQLGKPASEAEDFRSVLEGVAVVEAIAVERMHAFGAPMIQRIRVLGGSTRSALWNSIRSSVLEKPLEIIPDVETALGSAIQAFVGMGMPAGQAMKFAAKQSQIVEPDLRLVEVYRDLLHRYRVEFVRRGWLSEEEKNE